MKTLAILPLAALAAAGLSSCAHEAGLPDLYPNQTEALFGAAVRQNIAAQTVNPDAPTETTLSASGARAAIARKRYDEDKVEKPSQSSTLESISSTDDSGGSGE